MPQVQETSEKISFIEMVPNKLRIFLVIIGLIPIFLAPYEMLIRPHWKEFSLYLLFPILISIGAIAVGGFFIVAGLFGLNQALQFLVKSKTIHYSYESALIPLRKKTFKFSDVAKSEIKTHNWADGPSSYGLQFIFKDGQKIETGSFEKKAEAELYLNKVTRLIQ